MAAYHPAWKGEAAWIELVVDEIAKDLSKPLSNFRVLCDVVVGRVLFHEIGHHLDAVVGSVGRTGEHGAEAWRRRLLSRYLQQRHGYLRLLRPVFRVLYAAIRAGAGDRRSLGGFRTSQMWRNRVWGRDPDVSDAKCRILTA